MKVMMLAPEFLPVWGGVGTYIVEMARHLKDVELHILTPKRTSFGNGRINNDYYMEEIFPENVHIHFISNATDTFLYNAKFQYACFKHAPEIIRKNGIDLIHSHTAHMPDIMLQFRNLDVPVITTLHTTIEGQKTASRDSGLKFKDMEFSEKATYMLYPVLAYLERIYHKKKRNYIAVSNWTKNQILNKYKIDPESIEVIHNGVNTNLFSPGNGKKSFEHFPQLENIDVPLVLSTSRLIGAKGGSFLLEAIPKILKHTDAHFVFAGTGKNNINIPDDRCTFLGYVDYLKMPYLYSLSDIFILSSLYENFPISVLESMSSGTATISTNVGGVPEIIKDHENGLLIPSKDSDAIASSVITLAEDRDNRKKLSREARKDVENNFDWKIVSKVTRKAYESAIG